MTKVKLVDYFDILPAIQDDKMNFEISEINDVSSVPFLGRSALNNGIVGYVEPRERYINRGGIITIALDGSTGATFYQHHNFSSGQNIWLLVPKKEYFEIFDPLIALYCVTSIRKAVENYVGSYNLSLTKTRLVNNISLFLPLDDDGIVSISHIYNSLKNIRNIDLIKEVPNTRYKL